MGYDFALDFAKLKRIYRHLIILGFQPEESAKLVAHLMGIDITDTHKKWTLKELQHLDFLKNQTPNDN